MKKSFGFLRLVFVFLNISLSVIFALSLEFTTINFFIGIASGLFFSLILILSEKILKNIGFKSITPVILGTFCGLSIGLTANIILSQFLSITHTNINTTVLNILQASFFITAIYASIFITLNSLKNSSLASLFTDTEKMPKIILDSSVLKDVRIIDFASSGLLNNRALLPNFIVEQISKEYNHGSEEERSEAKKSLENIDKLKRMPRLKLVLSSQQVEDNGETLSGRSIKLARKINADILCANIGRIQSATIKDINIINIHTLANALKTITNAGETIKIKIQRQGKEPLQGIGYLEDSSMVVVNGGSSHIGKSITAHVLSVKYTSSGRIIFCNSAEKASQLAGVI